MDFARVFNEWALGVRSMVYQSGKGRIQAGDLERFRKLEGRMDQAWQALAPFEKEVFLSEKRRLI